MRRFLETPPRHRAGAYLDVALVRCGQAHCGCSHGRRRHGPYLYLRYWRFVDGRWKPAADYVPRDAEDQIRELIRRERIRAASSRLAALMVLGGIVPRSADGRWLRGWVSPFGKYRSRRFRRAAPAAT